MSVLGLDLSSSSTGVAGDNGTRTIRPKGTLHERARRIAHEIRAAVADDEPLVIIEAIGTRFVQAAIAAATVHALVRAELADAGLDVVEVPPAALKKWATGKGNADKDAMLLSAVRNGWSASEGATNDEADAFWLWTIGRAQTGYWEVPQTAYRLALIDELATHRQAA